jgi:hypothetical protein
MIKFTQVINDFERRCIKHLTYMSDFILREALPKGGGSGRGYLMYPLRRRQNFLL